MLSGGLPAISVNTLFALIGSRESKNNNAICDKATVNNIALAPFDIVPVVPSFSLDDDVDVDIF